MSDLVSNMATLVERFNRDILGINVPSQPTMLQDERLRAGIDLLQEEVLEFVDAETLEDQADAMLDLTYVALGRLLEMGIAPGPVFDEVHAANMRKKRGKLAKRPHNQGHDAVKPDGWTPPNLVPFLSVTRDQMIAAMSMDTLTARVTNLVLSDPAGQLDVYTHAAQKLRRPRLLVIGHARHGKDTVCELLRDNHGFKFTSSSMFLAERVVMPLLKEQYGYESVEACYEDRVNRRNEWYQAIRDFNRPDATRLARALLEEHDVYCGMRAGVELHACRNRRLFDHVIWVDASEREDLESAMSCTVMPWMADFVLDNNGSLEDLEMNLEHLIPAISVLKD